MTRTLLFLCLLIAPAFAATGTFTGEIVNGPKLDTGKKWIFVQGPHGSSRKVNITTAVVTFSPEVPQKARDERPQNAVREGAQIRVTASQDNEGEWQASTIEILKPAPR